VRSGIFLKLLACFLVVILAAAVMFDLMLGGAWESSLRAEIERNLVQKTKLLAHRVETDRSGHSLSDIAAQEAQAAGARVTIVDSAGNVLADSESSPDALGNVVQRKEFVTALSGNVGVDQRRSAAIGHLPRVAGGRCPGIEQAPTGNKQNLHLLRVYRPMYRPHGDGDGEGEANRFRAGYRGG